MPSVSGNSNSSQSTGGMMSASSGSRPQTATAMASSSSARWCSLMTHNTSHSAEELILNPDIFVDFHPHELIQLYDPERPTNRLILRVPNHIPSVATDHITEEEASVDFVELSFKKQYLPRGNMLRFKHALLGRAIHVNQNLNISSIQAQIQDLRKEKLPTVSGVITESTKFVFRSKSARIIWLVQISAEMWDVDPNGEMYFEKFLKEYANPIIDSWKALGVSHMLTVIFFARTLYLEKKLDMKTHPELCSKRSLQINNGLHQQDFFKIVIENITDVDKISQIKRLRHEFWTFAKLLGWKIPIEGEQYVLNNHGSSSTKVNQINYALPSDAIHGNFLEAINTTLNILDKHYMDRDLQRTGNSIVMISAGSGVYKVKPHLSQITKQRMLDNAFGIDFISLSRPPVHTVPLFIVDGKSESAKDFYEIPHWIRVSYIDCKHNLSLQSHPEGLDITMEPILSMGGEDHRWDVIWSKEFMPHPSSSFVTSALLYSSSLSTLCASYVAALPNSLRKLLVHISTSGHSSELNSLISAATASNNGTAAVPATPAPSQQTDTSHTPSQESKASDSLTLLPLPSPAKASPAPTTTSNLGAELIIHNKPYIKVWGHSDIQEASLADQKRSSIGSQSNNYTIFQKDVLSLKMTTQHKGNNNKLLLELLDSIPTLRKDNRDEFFVGSLGSNHGDEEGYQEGSSSNLSSSFYGRSLSSSQWSSSYEERHNNNGSNSAVDLVNQMNQQINNKTSLHNNQSNNNGDMPAIHVESNGNTDSSKHGDSAHSKPIRPTSSQPHSSLEGVMERKRILEDLGKSKGDLSKERLLEMMQQHDHAVFTHHKTHKVASKSITLHDNNAAYHSIENLVEQVQIVEEEISAKQLSPHLSKPVDTAVEPVVAVVSPVASEHNRNTPMKSKDMLIGSADGTVKPGPTTGTQGYRNTDMTRRFLQGRDMQKGYYPGGPMPPSALKKPAPTTPSSATNNTNNAAGALRAAVAGTGPELSGVSKQLAVKSSNNPAVQPSPAAISVPNTKSAASNPGANTASKESKDTAPLQPPQPPATTPTSSTTPTTMVNKRTKLSHKNFVAANQTIRSSSSLMQTNPRNSIDHKLDAQQKFTFYHGKIIPIPTNTELNHKRQVEANIEFLTSYAKQYSINPFRLKEGEKYLNSITHNRRRWSHVFPEGKHDNNRIVVDYGLNWKSLTQPAILPLSTDYLPTIKDLESNYTVNNYIITIDRTESPFASLDAALHELVCQRLSQEFQLVEGFDKFAYMKFNKYDVLAGSGGGSNNLNAASRLGGVGGNSNNNNNNHNSAAAGGGVDLMSNFYILTMGHRIQFLLGDRTTSQIYVTQYISKKSNISQGLEDSNNSTGNNNSSSNGTTVALGGPGSNAAVPNSGSFAYQYEMWLPQMNKFQTMSQSFTQFPTHEFLWNKVDNIMMGSISYDGVEEAKKPRSLKYSIIPHDIHTEKDLEEYYTKMDLFIDFINKYVTNKEDMMSVVKERVLLDSVDIAEIPPINKAVYHYRQTSKSTAVSKCMMRTSTSPSTGGTNAITGAESYANWIYIKYDTVMYPYKAFHFVIHWFVCDSWIVDDFCNLLFRRCSKWGLRLSHIPGYFAQSNLNVHPFRPLPYIQVPTPTVAIPAIHSSPVRLVERLFFARSSGWIFDSERSTEWASISLPQPVYSDRDRDIISDERQANNLDVANSNVSAATGSTSYRVISSISKSLMSLTTSTKRSDQDGTDGTAAEMMPSSYFRKSMNKTDRQYTYATGIATVRMGASGFLWLPCASAKVSDVNMPAEEKVDFAMKKFHALESFVVAAVDCYELLLEVVEEVFKQVEFREIVWDCVDTAASSSVALTLQSNVSMNMLAPLDTSVQGEQPVVQLPVTPSSASITGPVQHI